MVRRGSLFETKIRSKNL